MKQKKVFFVHCEKCRVKSFEDNCSSALDHRLINKKWKRVKNTYTCPKCNGWDTRYRINKEKTNSH